jgi:hypothetical protein
VEKLRKLVLVAKVEELLALCLAEISGFPIWVLGAEDYR